MAARPIPKELVVSRPSSASLLWITASSNDAAQWIEREAPLFGNFYMPTVETHYTLFVADTHDTDEVKQYLESYGSEAHVCRTAISSHRIARAHEATKKAAPMSSAAVSDVRIKKILGVEHE